jgi:hypothetical protein
MNSKRINVHLLLNRLKNLAKNPFGSSSSFALGLIETTDALCFTATDPGFEAVAV